MNGQGSYKSQSGDLYSGEFRNQQFHGKGRYQSADGEVWSGRFVDGALTGVAVEPIVDAQRKADLLRELAHKEGLRLEQTIAVGDGANDLPMLGLAGLGVPVPSFNQLRMQAAVWALQMTQAPTP
mgnify:CR=1 FL=1